MEADASCAASMTRDDGCSALNVLCEVSTASATQLQQLKQLKQLKRNWPKLNGKPAPPAACTCGACEVCVKKRRRSRGSSSADKLGMEQACGKQKMTVHEQRSAVSMLMKACYYMHNCVRKKYRGMWKVRPHDWPDSVPFMDPCNGKNKPKADQLATMLSFLRSKLRSAENDCPEYSQEILVEETCGDIPMDCVEVEVKDSSADFSSSAGPDDSSNSLVVPLQNAPWALDGGVPTQTSSPSHVFKRPHPTPSAGPSSACKRRALSARSNQVVAVGSAVQDLDLLKERLINKMLNDALPPLDASLLSFLYPEKELKVEKENVEDYRFECCFKNGSLQLTITSGLHRYQVRLWDGNRLPGEVAAASKSKQVTCCPLSPCLYKSLKEHKKNPGPVLVTYDGQELF